ncbi:MAG TPA: hypothetical protein VJU61_22470 [Polyangiaceae bacterium]|nr:hypothetical protein [Polyangiaceae bacterium]
MFRSPFSARSRVACCLALAGLTCWGKRAAAGDPGGVVSWRPAAATENSLKTVHLRKLARKVLHWGKASEDEEPIRLGFASARLLWQKKWKWYEPTPQPKFAGGMLGGPVLSIGVPLRTLSGLLSIEVRLCSFRYVYADLRSERMLLEELADPHEEHQSLEAGLHLTLPLPEIF